MTCLNLLKVNLREKVLHSWDTFLIKMLVFVNKLRWCTTSKLEIVTLFEKITVK